MRKSEALLLAETLGDEWMIFQPCYPSHSINFYRRVPGFWTKWKWYYVGYCVSESTKTIYCDQSKLEYATILEEKIKSLGYEVELTVG